MKTPWEDAVFFLECAAVILGFVSVVTRISSIIPAFFLIGIFLIIAFVKLTNLEHPVITPLVTFESIRTIIAKISGEVGRLESSLTSIQYAFYISLAKASPAENAIRALIVTAYMFLLTSNDAHVLVFFWLKWIDNSPLGVLVKLMLVILVLTFGFYLASTYTTYAKTAARFFVRRSLLRHIRDSKDRLALVRQRLVLEADSLGPKYDCSELLDGPIESLEKMAIAVGQTGRRISFRSLLTLISPILTASWITQLASETLRGISSDYLLYLFVVPSVLLLVIFLVGFGPPIALYGSVLEYFQILTVRKSINELIQRLLEMTSDAEVLRETKRSFFFYRVKDQ